MLCTEGEFDVHNATLIKRVQKLFPDCEVEQHETEEGQITCLRLQFVYEGKTGTILAYPSREMTLDEATKFLKLVITQRMKHMVQEFPNVFGWSH